jgi:hypothetical protein
MYSQHLYNPEYSEPNAEQIANPQRQYLGTLGHPIPQLGTNACKRTKEKFK